MTKNVRVAVNGYGIIGKRVADAIRLQPDMELVGVGDVVSDYRVKAAVILGLPIYASLPEKADEMQAHRGQEPGALPGGRREGHLPGRREARADGSLLRGPGQLCVGAGPGRDARRLV